MPRLEGLGSLRAAGLPESLGCCYPSLYHHHQGTGTCTYLTLGRALSGCGESRCTSSHLQHSRKQGDGCIFHSEVHLGSSCFEQRSQHQGIKETFLKGRLGL